MDSKSQRLNVIWRVAVHARSTGEPFTASCVAPWPQSFHSSAWYSSPLELPAALAGSFLKCGEQWGEQIEASSEKT